MVRPGYLCTWAGLAAGFAMDAFVCQPAVHAYKEKVGLLILCMCLVLLLICKPPSCMILPIFPPMTSAPGPVMFPSHACDLSGRFIVITPLNCFHIL